MMRMEMIQMVDLHGQYLKVKDEIDAAIRRVIDSTQFIRGTEVADFENELSAYTHSKHTITCANGTDALVLSLMALDLKPGDEVITVPFTFVSTIEAIAFLNLTPVFVDVCPDTYNMDVSQIEKAITPKTKAILPVHLFGQCADMEAIVSIARQYGLFVIEDACQAIGAEVRFSDGTTHQAGTMGDIGCTSFFPSKNLGCYGDGGALFTQDAERADRLRELANHGSAVKYHHHRVGMNSRLDTIQAAILSVKLKHLDAFIQSRRQAAAFYDKALKDNPRVVRPAIADFSNHVYHQYTLKCQDGFRDSLMEYLKKAGVPTAVYYPIPLHLQKAYAFLGFKQGAFPVSEMLAASVLSLPMHTELSQEQLDFIVEQIHSF